MNRQSQRSGDNSTQIQTTGSISVGVTEERVRQIVGESARALVEEYATESTHVIQERIAKLDDRVIASLIRSGRLEVFADPGFQRSYRKAQNGAAVSEFEADYDLLSALLTDRAERGEDRRIRLGIERSIEIVDQIEESALRGLTVLQALMQYHPLAGTLNQGLDTMEGLYRDLVDGPLPLGAEWIDQLDLLDAGRPSSIQQLMSFREFYPQIFRGAVAPGALATEEFPPLIIGETITSLRDIGLLAPHELKPGYVRLCVNQEASLDTMASHITPEDRARIVEQGKLHLGFGTIDPEVVDAFLECARSRPTIRNLEIWWSQVPQAIRITSVGRVLARANALRLDVRKVLPPIE